METKKQMARIFAKAWADEAYKTRFLADPATVLKEEGIQVHEDISLRAIEEAPGQKTIILPAPPADMGSVEDMEERLAASLAYPFFPYSP